MNNNINNTTKKKGMSHLTPLGTVTKKKIHGVHSHPGSFVLGTMPTGHGCKEIRALYHSHGVFLRVDSLQAQGH